MLVHTRRIAEAISRKKTKSLSETAQFQLNRALNCQSLVRAFQRKGRLQVPAILRREDAQALYRCLSERTQWGLMLRSGPGIGRRYASPEQCKAFTDLQHRTLHKMAHAFKRKEGSHLMGVRAIGQDLFDRETDASLLSRFVDFLNSKAFLNFARDITGARDIRCVSAQATRFTEGHFCSFHVDAIEEDQQRATCVFSLSPTWQRSWGGLLRFANTHGKVEEVFVPCFNSMSIFRYSQKHAVSVVTRQAQMPRYSVAAALIAK
jgi:hypothetical protein